MKNLAILVCAATLLAGCGGQNEGQDPEAKGNPQGKAPATSAVAGTFSVEKIEELVGEAKALFDKGKYNQAKTRLTEAYGAFQRQGVKDES